MKGERVRMKYLRQWERSKVMTLSLPNGYSQSDGERREKRGGVIESERSEVKVSLHFCK